MAMASRRVWLALLFCALLPPSQLADPAAAAAAADAANTDSKTGGTKPDGTPTATPTGTETTDPKTGAGEVEPDGTPAATPTGTDNTDPKIGAGGANAETPTAGTPTGAATGEVKEVTAGGAAVGAGPAPEKSTEKPVVPEKPPTVQPPSPSPETSSSKQTTTSTTSTTTTTLRPPPPKPQPTGACPEPNWNERNNTEISAYVRCKKGENGEKEHVLKCAYNPATDAENEAAVREKAMKYGRELPVCFLARGGKRGKKWVYREELAKILDFPLMCKTEECAGENVIGHFEYRCVWDNCNDKLEVGPLSAVCRRKLVNERKRQNKNARVNKKKIVKQTTLPPLPKLRGMDEYNELYDRLKADHGEEADFDDDEESGNHTPHPHEAKKEESSSSVARNQFAIAGPLALLWIL